MQSHTTIGAAILAGSGAPLLQTAESIALTHHERWDGTGYPAGLRGDAVAELKAQRGRHFDPAVVDAFVAMAPRLEESTDARDDPGVGVLTLDQSTPAGACERTHSRNTLPPTRA